ncbi:hypothetical protein IF2G_01414 [Cordyceps javanica]|nr:hypothetical protein IF2G_01414 [Cordyceps javanica]
MLDQETLPQSYLASHITHTRGVSLVCTTKRTSASYEQIDSLLRKSSAFLHHTTETVRPNLWQSVSHPKSPFLIVRDRQGPETGKQFAVRSLLATRCLDMIDQYYGYCVGSRLSTYYSRIHEFTS